MFTAIALVLFVLLGISGTSRKPPTDVLHLEDVPTTAARLSVTTKEVRRLIARGELFSVKLGRRRLIPSYVVDEYIRGLVAEAEAG